MSVNDLSLFKNQRKTEKYSDYLRFDKSGYYFLTANNLNEEFTYYHTI
jgi:hypothetical protein